MKMITNLKFKTTFLVGIATLGFLGFLLVSCKGKKTEKSTESMLCVGDYWTEAQGIEFLDQQRKTYTSAEAWEKRAQQIRTQILKGAGLEKFPDKCPLNTYIGERRVYDGNDYTKNTPKVEYPHIKYIYGLLGKPELVENAHFALEKHGYDYSKRAEVYPFLAKYLGLDLSKAVNPDGSLKEEGIVIEKQKALYPFDEKHPFPEKGIRKNDDVKWN